MKCIIVDDNKMARMALKQLVSQVQTLELVAECSNAMEAYNQLAANPIDLLFLDIEMPEMSGIDLIKKLGAKKPLIIFTTAKTDYAVEAFELNVVDYLVKPIAQPRLLQAVEKAQELASETPNSAVLMAPARVTIIFPPSCRCVS